MPIRPSVLGIDVAKAAAFGHPLGVGGLHHHHDRAVADARDFLLGQAAAGLTLGRREDRGQRRNEHWNQVGPHPRRLTSITEARTRTCCASTSDGPAFHGGLGLAAPAIGHTGTDRLIAPARMV
jgi:hypothetical protein